MAVAGENAGKFTGDRWLRRFRDAPGARVRLVCLPHAGGSAGGYFPLAASLPSTVDVLAVQYPGRQDRRAERCLEDVGALADRIHAALRPWTGLPLALFGHSMGAAVAFEVALRLEATGVAPRALFVSGRRAPSRFRDERMHLCSDEVLIAEARALNGTEADLLADRELRDLLLPALRGDYKAAETYRWVPGRVLRCPVVGLVGDSDPKASIGEMRAWAGHTEAGFELQVFSGGHFYLSSCGSTVSNTVRERLLPGRPG